MEVQTSVAMTDVGRVRKVNQDYVYASDTPVGNLPNLYIVADGMGGHKAGDLASSYAVQTIVEAISRSVETRPAAGKVYPFLSNSPYQVSTSP